MGNLYRQPSLCPNRHKDYTYDERATALSLFDEGYPEYQLNEDHIDKGRYDWTDTKTNINGEYDLFPDDYEFEVNMFTTTQYAQTNVWVDREEGTSMSTESCVFDTGATTHVTNDKRFLTNVVHTSQVVLVAQVTRIQATKLGSLIL
jgi:hypothetical protein